MPGEPAPPGRRRHLPGLCAGSAPGLPAFFKIMLFIVALFPLPAKKKVKPAGKKMPVGFLLFRFFGFSAFFSPVRQARGAGSGPANRADPPRHPAGKGRRFSPGKPGRPAPKPLLFCPLSPG